MGLADGSIHILIGTHAIFQQAVAYKKLGLAVVDEQHRFGVAQRMMLAAKGRAAAASAGDDRDADPAHADAHPLWRDGRQPARRDAAGPPADRDAGDQRASGCPRWSTRSAATSRRAGQAYWVCPLVEESETIDLAAAEDARRGCCGCASATRSALVHGRMKGPEKDAVMAAFQRGRIARAGRDDGDRGRRRRAQRDADDRRACRPLRPRPAPPAARPGRARRPAQRSACCCAAMRSSETARARLTLMRETNDGFRIAEEDLRLRGAGEMLGTRQSGEAAVPPRRAPSRSPSSRRWRWTTRGCWSTATAGWKASAARRRGLLLYLLERDAAVGLLRGG